MNFHRTQKSVFLLLLLEIQRSGVDAVAQSGRVWAIFKHMTQVRVASRAVHFIAHHPKAAIYRFLYMIADVIEITRPASAAFKLGAAVKQLQSTANAGIDPAFLEVPVGTRKRTLRIVFSGYEILLLRQLFFPVTIGFRDFLHVCLRLSKSTQQQDGKQW